MKRWVALPFLFGLAWFVAGCQRDDMWIQAKTPRLGESTFFADGRVAREPVAGTIAHGAYSSDTILSQGLDNGKPSERFPFAVDEAVLVRGKAVYAVNCQPCHGAVGDGVGIVVQRGYRHPGPLADPRVLKMPIGEVYRRCLNGVPRPADREPDILAGTGYALDDVVHPVLWRKLSSRDRWSVLAWVKVLQASQHFPATELSAEETQKLGQAVAPRSQNGNR